MDHLNDLTSLNFLHCLKIIDLNFNDSETNTRAKQVKLILLSTQNE